MNHGKIIHIKMHQAVTFEKALVSFFSSEKIAGRTRAEMTMVPELGCILVESSEDKALIPLVNIAFIKLETESSKEELKKKKKESEKPVSNLKQHEIPRPR